MRREEPDPALDPESRARVVLRTRKSPAFWYSALGLLVLGATFLIPVVTARRTARAELRGDVLAELLLRAATAMPFVPLDQPWAHALLFARLDAAAVAHGVFVEDLELLPAPAGATAVTLANKHYVLQLRRSTPPPGPASDAEPALEAMAWPLHAASPAHAVFFHPADAEPAYSRNLQAGYLGEEPAHWPRPGAAHRRLEGHQDLWSYRGVDDERWILFDRPMTTPAGTP